MNEEEYIRERMGNRNPFIVPEGYFDRLADEVIGKTKPKPAMVRYLRPLLYAAACAAMAIAVSTVFRSQQQDDTLLMAQQQEATAYSDTYMDDMADYAMLDNEDIYAGLLADL